MGMFSSIGGLVGGYFGMPQLGAMAGGLLDSNKSVSRAGDLSGQVAGMSEDQYQKALPWDVSGQFGGIKYDREGKAVSTELSEPWQQQMDRLMGRATTTGEQISKYSADPMIAQQQLYEQQQALFAPEQERQRLSQEARLLAQGRLGTTGGAGQMQALLEAQGMQNLQRQYGAFDKSMDMGTTMREWEESDIAQSTDIGKLPQDYLQMAKSGSVTSDPYAKSLSGAAGGVRKTRQRAFDKFGTELEGMLGGDNSYDYDYTEDYGSAAGTAGNPGFGPNTMYSGAGKWTYV